SPIVKLLGELRNGKIDANTYEKQKNKFQRYDVRDDYMKYVYRNSVTQQYYTSLAYGSKKLDFRGSLGYDRSAENVRNNSTDRISAKFVTSIRPTDRFSVDLNIGFSDNGRKTQGNDSKV